MEGIVYIIAFGLPLGSSRHQARYYIGWCEPGRLQCRFQEHLRGQGAAITRACVAQGIPLHLIYSQPGTRADERRLKNQKNTPRLVRRLKQQGVI